jgi:hypothetical protein
VGRIIARPFTGAPGEFRRTEGRRDFALAPPSRSYLEELERVGAPVHGVGKIADLFAGVGVVASHPGATNAQALESVEGLLGELEEGLVFVNLIDTDQVYGHRSSRERPHPRVCAAARGERGDARRTRGGRGAGRRGAGGLPPRRAPRRCRGDGPRLARRGPRG